ncbi:BTB/POZ domain-containing protein 9-like, partial [Adelges cooleyi]|uniref:BTB/POZ domain-containing protein 9-like n=1 Tax=Adelges cooleyi TaxID=133065 RepID=UPI00217FDF88
MAQLYQYNRLEDEAYNVVINRTLDVFQSKDFLLLSVDTIQDILNRNSVCPNEIEIFRAVFRWIKANQNDLDPDDKIKVLSVVRYQLMNDEELSEVRKSQLVSSETISNAIQTRNTCSLNNLNYRYKYVCDIDVTNTSYAYPVINEIDDGTMINLGLTTDINYIKFMLKNCQTRDYSYYVEVSINGHDWVRVVDHSNYNCLSIQRLWIYPRIVQYIRVQIVENKCTAIASFKFWKVVYNSEEMHLMNIKNGLM